MFATNMYPTERMIVEAASAIIFFVLVRFMIKPYQLTREGRYLGLPLGFGFLGVSSALAAFSYSPLIPQNLATSFLWPPVLARTFAFVFIAVTYFFSDRTSRRSRLLGNITISFLVIALAILLIMLFVAPEFTFKGYSPSNVYLRAFNIACLVYVCIFTLRSHVRNPDPTTIWIPFGFIFLAISQYTLLFWYLDTSFSAFIASLVDRFVSLAIFLWVAYRAFYRSIKKDG